MMTAIKKYFFLFFLISINAYGGATIAPQCEYNDRIIIQFDDNEKRPNWDTENKTNYSISNNTISHVAYSKKRKASVLFLGKPLVYGQEYTATANNDSTTFVYYGDSNQAEVSFDGNKFLADKDINYSWVSSLLIWNSPFGWYGKTDFIGEYNGYVRLSKSEKIKIESIDGFKLWSNGTLITNKMRPGFQSVTFSKSAKRWERIRIQMYNDGSRTFPWFWYEEYARFKVSAKNVSQCVPSKFKPKIPSVTVNAPDKGSLCSDTIIDVFSDKKYVKISAKYGKFYIHSGRGKIKDNKYYFDKKDNGKVRLKLVNKRQLTDTWFIDEESGTIDFYSTSIVLSNINDIAHTNNSVVGTYMNYDNGVCEVADINEQRDILFLIQNNDINKSNFAFNGSSKNYNSGFISRQNIVNGKFSFNVNFPQAGYTKMTLTDEKMSGFSETFIKPDNIDIVYNNKNIAGKFEDYTATVTGNGKLVTNYNLISDKLISSYEIAHIDMTNDAPFTMDIDNKLFNNGVYKGKLKYDEVGILKINLSSNFFNKSFEVEFIPHRFELTDKQFGILYGEDSDWTCQFNIYGQDFRTDNDYIELVAKNYEGKPTLNYHKGLYSFNKELSALNSFNGNRYSFFSFSGGGGTVLINIPSISFKTDSVNEPINPSVKNLSFYIDKNTLFDDNIKFDKDLTVTSQDILFKFGKFVAEDVTSSTEMAEMQLKFQTFNKNFSDEKICFTVDSGQVAPEVPFEFFGDYIEIFSNGNKRVKMTVDVPEYLVYKESNVGVATFLQRVRNVYIREVYRDQYK